MVSRMARALSLASCAAAATAYHATDAVAMIQAQTTVQTSGSGSGWGAFNLSQALNLSQTLNLSQIPGIGDLLKGMAPGGSTAAGSPAIAAPPAMPTMADLMELGQQVLKLLRNDTLMEEVHEMLRNMTSAQQTRIAAAEAQFAELGSALSAASEQELIPDVSRFLQSTVLGLKPQLKEDFETLARFLRKLDLGAETKHIKLGIAMAEPFLLTQFDAAAQPILDQIQTLGNASKRDFCRGVVPGLDNLTAVIEPLDGVSKTIKSVRAETPKLAQSPLMFMAPDVVPKIQKLADDLIDLDGGLVQWMQMLSARTNTTIGAAAFTKLNCRSLMSGVGHGASLAAPLLAAAALLLTSVASPRED